MDNYFDEDRVPSTAPATGPSSRYDGTFWTVLAIVLITFWYFRSRRQQQVLRTGGGGAGRVASNASSAGGGGRVATEAEQEARRLAIQKRQEELDQAAMKLKQEQDEQAKLRAAEAKERQEQLQLRKQQEKEREEQKRKAAAEALAKAQESVRLAQQERQARAAAAAANPSPLPPANKPPANHPPVTTSDASPPPATCPFSGRWEQQQAAAAAAVGEERDYTVELSVQTVSAQSAVAIEMHSSQTILDLKRLVAIRYPGSPSVESQKLIWSGKVLADGETIHAVFGKRLPKSGPFAFTVHLVIRADAAGASPVAPVNRG